MENYSVSLRIHNVAICPRYELVFYQDRPVFFLSFNPTDISSNDLERFIGRPIDTIDIGNSHQLEFEGNYMSVLSPNINMIIHVTDELLNIFGALIREIKKFERENHEYEDQR